MPPRREIHHLRRYRKRVGLSRQQLAQLLGCETGGIVSRYEHFHRLPSLERAIAFEIALGVNLEALFPQLYERVRTVLARRAQALRTQRSGRASLQSVTVINLLANPSMSPNNSIHHETITHLIADACN